MHFNFILFVMLLIIAASTTTQLVQRMRRILLIGDSLDRLIVSDYCNLKDGHFSQWGDHTIKYGGQKGTKMPSAICHENAKTMHSK